MAGKKRVDRDPEDSVEESIRDLLSSQSLAVLSTLEEDGPYASLIAFAASDDLCSMIFATSRHTRKYGNLSSQDRVALLVDNRRHDVSDFHKAMAVTVLGSVREIPDKEKAPFLRLYLEKHPHLVDFARAPTCALLEVKVERYLLVRQFQQVSVLSMKS